MIKCLLRRQIKKERRRGVGEEGGGVTYMAMEGELTLGGARIMPLRDDVL